MPVDMVYFDNAGDPARAVANAEAAIAAHVDLLIEIGERDTKTLRLGPCGTETACKQSGQQWPAPQHRPRRHALLNRLDVDEGAGQADRLGHRHRQGRTWPGVGHDHWAASRAWS